LISITKDLLVKWFALSISHYFRHGDYLFLEMRKIVLKGDDPGRIQMLLLLRASPPVMTGNFLTWEPILIKIGSDNLFCKTKNFSKFNM